MYQSLKLTIVDVLLDGLAVAIALFVLLVAWDRPEKSSFDK